MGLTIQIKILRILILIQSVICLAMIPVIYLASSLISIFLPDIFHKYLMILPLIVVLISVFQIILFIKTKQNKRWAFIIIYILSLLGILTSILSIFSGGYVSGIIMLLLSSYYAVYFTFDKKGKRYIRNIQNDEDNVIIFQNELNAKSYIEKYKSKYPKNDIKKSLTSIGLLEEEVDKYLKKYF